MTQAVADRDALDRAFEIEPLDVARVKLGAEAVCLCAQRTSEAWPVHRLREAGVIVHLPRVHQSPAGPMALDDEGVQACPCGINRRGVARRTRPDDDDVTNPTHILHQHAMLKRCGASGSDIYMPSRAR